MGLYRLPLSEDCFITQEFKYGNSGKDPVLDVGVKYSTSSLDRSIQRILGIIDLSSSSDLRAKINSGYIPDPTTDLTVTAKLKMFNVIHAQRQARSFNLDVFPLTSEWNEGSGIGFGAENDLYVTGYANYISRKAGIDWATSGGDYLIDSNSATQSFDSGNEDLSVDISPMLRNWLSGVSSNYGFLIKMQDTYENATGSYSASYDLWRKSFFGRETRLLKWPRLELVWDDQIKDYRQIFTIGSSGYLYFYNFANNRYIDLASTSPFPGYVAIEGLTSNSSTAWVSVSSGLSSLSASRIRKGIYRVLISELPYSLYSTYTKFRDKWVVTSSVSGVLSSASAYITVVSPFNYDSFSNIEYSKYTLHVRNVQTEYQKGAKINLRLFTKDLSKTFEVLTASSSSFTSEISDDGYWKAVTNRGEVDIDWQPLDFDKNGNFLVLDTNNLTRNYKYQVDFKLNVKGQDLYFDGKDIPAQFTII